MKKYLPILLFCLVLTGFLTGQIVFDFMPGFAVPSSKLASELANGTSAFKLLKNDLAKDENSKLKMDTGSLVLINFWASWCGPCRDELPSLNELKQKYSDKELYVVGINADEATSFDAANIMIKELGLNFDNIFDPNQKYLKKFMVNSLPTSILFKDGQAIKVVKGQMDFNSPDFIKEINTALKDLAQ